ncbi:dienelactone hydrolase family protein [bacterium]
MVILRNLHAIIIILTVCFMGLNCSFSTESDTESSNFNLSNTSITVDNITMHYTKAVHKSYAPDSDPFALILALHYGGEPHNDMGREFLEALILPAYKQLRAVIVAPVVLSSGSWANKESEKLVLALLDKMMDNYNINSNRILVTGFSLGGIGTWYMAARNSDFFTAAIPVSGLPPEGIFPISELPPTYVIHSTTDEIFSFSQVETTVTELQNNKLPVELYIVDTISHYSTSGFIPALETSIDWLLEIW